MGSSGSKQATQTTTSTPLTQEQLDPWGSAYRKSMMGMLWPKVEKGEGLSPQEKAYYTGQGLGALENESAGAQKTLKENFARAGIGPNDGAFAESLGNLLRQKYASRVGLYSDLVGKDIAMKHQNLADLMGLATNSGQVVSGGSTTTTETPSTGSKAKNVLGGVLGGGMGGAAIGGSTAALNPYMLPLALGGAVLGGVGGLF